MFTFTNEQIEAAIHAEVAEFVAVWDAEMDGDKEATMKARTEWHRDQAAKGELEMLKPYLGVFPVLSYRLGEAKKALEKLAKKAMRYGTAPITWVAGPEYPVTQRNEFGHKYTVMYNDIKVEGLEAPKVGNFTFVAKLEVTPAGTIVDCVPGEALPERYRRSDGECEHCGAKRDRKHLYVVRDQDGLLVQVGHTCLRDYMGTDTPAGVAARFRFQRELRAFDEEWGGRGGKSPDLAIELLAITSVAIRLWGWVPKSAPESAGEPTAFRIAKWFYLHPADKHGKLERDVLEKALGPDDYALAERVLEWVKEQQKVSNSDYIHNLAVILAPGAVDANRRGYACSAVAAYQRDVAKQEQAKREKEAAATSTSTFQGKIGERLRGLELTVMSNRGVSTDYGDSILYKMVDRNGNVFSWFSLAADKLEVGRTYKMDVTVKAHSVYAGVQETRINRGRVL